MSHKYIKRELTEAEAKAFSQIAVCKHCGITRKKSKFGSYSYQRSLKDHSFKEPDCEN